MKQHNVNWKKKLAMQVVNGKSSTSNFTNIKKEMRIDHIALFSCNLETMRQFFLDHFEAESNEAVDAKTIELRDAGYR